MTEIPDRELTEAAQAYRRVADVPRDLIWRRIESTRQHSGRNPGAPAPHRRLPGAMRFAAAAALVVAGAVAGTVVENRIRHRDAGSPAATEASLVSPAVARYLASSDSLITVFRMVAESGRVRGDFGPWARELIDRTHELERSPSAADPALARLLADLDLVLIQIAQYADRPSESSLELRLIEEAIDARRVASQLDAVRRGRDAAGG